MRRVWRDGVKASSAAKGLECRYSVSCKSIFPFTLEDGSAYHFRSTVFSRSGIPVYTHCMLLFQRPQTKPPRGASEEEKTKVIFCRVGRRRPAAPNNDSSPAIRRCLKCEREGCQRAILRSRCQSLEQHLAIV